MNKINTLTTLATLTSLLLCAPAQAAPSWAQTEPAVGNCVPYLSDNSDLASHNWGVINWSGSSYSMTCPIASQTGLVDATKLNGVQLLAYDGHSGASISANLCVSNPTTGSIYCGSTAKSGNSTVGAVAMWLTPPSGSFLSYYTASIFVSLIGRQCTSSSLFGCSNYRESIIRSYNVWRK